MKKIRWLLFIWVCILLSGCAKGQENLTESERAMAESTPASSQEGSREETEIYMIEITTSESESKDASIQTSEELTGEIETTSEHSEDTEQETTQEITKLLRKKFEPGASVSETVNQINEFTLQAEASGVADILEKDVWTYEEIRQKITSYAFPDCSYLNGEFLTEYDRNRIEAARNLEGLGAAGNADVQYGVLSENTAVRSFPTMERITKEPYGAVEDFDYFQESMLLAGEGVAVLHSSSDNAYLFVQAQNYCGWIRRETVEICGRQILEGWLNAYDIGVITDSYANIPDISRKLRMGTRLLLLEERENKKTLLLPCGREMADGWLEVKEDGLCYMQILAEGGFVDEEGEKLWVKEISVINTQANAGFLPFSQENILIQAEKLLGTPYGWGDEGEKLDCTSTIGSIYRCFGVILPRNSGIMNQTGTLVTDISGWDMAEKRAYITSLPIGTILIMQGHGMLYMGYQTITAGGEELYTPVLLHTVTGYMDLDGSIQVPMSCVETSLDISVRSGVPYLELLKYCIIFPAQ